MGGLTWLIIALACDYSFFFFFQAEDGIRDYKVTGVQTCALPICDADCVFLDLEDAVAPADKEQARTNVIAGLLEHDWRARGKTVCVRINGIDTHYMYRDVVDVVEQAGHRLDVVLVPKVGVPADVYLVDALLTQIEAARRVPHRIGVEVLIETALGMANVEAIAQASRRLEAMHFGVADLAASLRARTVSIGGPHPRTPPRP